MNDNDKLNSQINFLSEQINRARNARDIFATMGAAGAHLKLTTQHLIDSLKQDRKTLIDSRTPAGVTGEFYKLGYADGSRAKPQHKLFPNFSKQADYLSGYAAGYSEALIAGSL